ncbi:GD17779 [Drosophila simulans]|uniref:GD17779 n=1 Tax=Drosophila simulans TaxID=7240 RepID=B4QWC4_DROSI|nr:GD17779 [Drosophila simulans]
MAKNRTSLNGIGWMDGAEARKMILFYRCLAARQGRWGRWKANGTAMSKDQSTGRGTTRRYNSWNCVPRPMRME